MTNHDELLNLLEDCENREQRLTDWERNFIDNLRNRLDSSKGATPQQEEKLLEIWERVTSG